MTSVRRSLVGICLVFLLLTPRVLADTTITVIDVGQGDAIWVHDDTGYDALIDAGPTSAGAAVLATLGEIENLDTVVWTHAHADHIGGMGDVLASYPVEEILWNGLDYDSATFNDLIDLVGGYHIPLTAVRTGDSFAWGDCTAHVVHPDRAYANTNNSSVVIRLTCHGTSMMLTGDAEWDAETAMIDSGYNLSADILKVSHHGSASSSSSLFLRAVQPDVALVSVGHNDYGHPSSVILERAADDGIATFRTDEDGDITIYINDSGYTISTGAVPLPLSDPARIALPIIISGDLSTLRIPTATPMAAATMTSTPTPTRTATTRPTRTPTPTATYVALAPCSCSSNSLNCGDFSSHWAAQRCFDYCWQQRGYDVHRLDSDGDGDACESLP